jgi:gamma-glutamyltranspeptidase/glutathione hydrolase
MSAAQPGIIRYDTLHHPVIARQGMVVSQRMIASQVGADILAGGGGFMLVYLAESGETLALDYREMAPALANRGMFLDSAGNVVSNTYTLNFSFGSGIMVTGAGFLMNNEMDDFSAKPESPMASV